MSEQTDMCSPMWPQHNCSRGKRSKTPAQAMPRMCSELSSQLGLAVASSQLIGEAPGRRRQPRPIGEKFAEDERRGEARVHVDGRFELLGDLPEGVVAWMVEEEHRLPHQT